MTMSTVSTCSARDLEPGGFDVATACDAESGVAAALSGSHRVVLDVMMPRMTGIEALGRIRAKSRIPIVMLTARGDDADRIVGLELGADDYVPKPCTPRELAARIRAILRRVQGTDAPAHKAGGDRPDRSAARRSAVRTGRSPLDLTSTEFNLLEVLVRNAGRGSARNCPSER